MKQVNILQVIQNLDVGGMEKQLFEEGSRLSKGKYNLTVCCLLSGGYYATAFKKIGIETIVLNRVSKTNPLMFFDLINVLKEKRIDLIHTHLFISNFWGRLAACIAHTPIIISSEMTTYRWVKLFHRALNRALLPRTDIIRVNSNAIRNLLIKESIPPQKINVIYNGKDLDEFDIPVDKDTIRQELDIESARFVVGDITKFRKEKGTEYFIQAMPLVLKAIPDVVFVLVGEGPEKVRLRKLVQKLQLGRRIIFTGLRHDIPSVLKSLDLLVLPSLCEGFPNSVLEAMAAGTPVVATRVGGTPELVLDGHTGVLVPPANPPALADAITKTLLSPKKRVTISQNARSLVQQKFTIESSVNQLEFLYDALIEKKLCRCRS